MPPRIGHCGRAALETLLSRLPVPSTFSSAIKPGQAQAKPDISRMTVLLGIRLARAPQPGRRPLLAPSPHIAACAARSFRASSHRGRPWYTVSCTSARQEQAVSDTRELRVVVDALGPNPRTGRLAGKHAAGALRSGGVHASHERGNISAGPGLQTGHALLRNAAPSVCGQLLQGRKGIDYCSVVAEALATLSFKLGGSR